MALRLNHINEGIMVVRFLLRQTSSATTRTTRTATTAKKKIPCSFTKSSYSCREISSRSFTSSISTPKEVFWCGKVVFPDETRPGSIVVDHSTGTIESTHPGQTEQEAQELAHEQNLKFTNLGSEMALSPGLIDVHVHISAIGREWEGYTTATQAAAAGGITTVINMPLNSIPATTTVENFQNEIKEAETSSLFANVGYWGGIVPSNVKDSTILQDIVETGILGLKAFLSPLPPAAGFVAVSPEELEKAAKICGLANKPILVHSELMTEEERDQALENSFASISDKSSSAREIYQAHVASRPAKWEQDAVRVVCGLTDRCHMHIVHLSDFGCLKFIAFAKARHPGRLTVETCPHYLLFDSAHQAILLNNDSNQIDNRIKCFPPIRDRVNRELLWSDGIASGLIDIIASDHSPCEPDMRSGDFQNVWGGLSGLQYQLLSTWSEASVRAYSLQDMAKWWSQNPYERLLKASLSKSCKIGSIEKGYRADLCWWDPEHIGMPDDYQKEYHRWKGASPYSTMSTMKGRVLGTWVTGEQVYDGEADEHKAAAGRLLLAG